MAYKCYKGSSQIKKIYKGSTMIKKIYKGSTLVWRYEPYEPNTVVYESSTGGASRTLNLEAGLYQVILVGAGGGGCGLGTTYHSFDRGTAASGGSGSALNCVFNLPDGSYAVSVGSGGSAITAANVGTGYGDVKTAGSGGNSKFGTTIAYGGSGGYGRFDYAFGGDGGSAPTITYTRKSTSLNVAGNTGEGIFNDNNYTSVSGGASVYSNKGTGGNAKCGKGSSAGTASNGGAGYVKVIYIGQP